MRKLTALAVAAALSLGVTAAYASQSEGGFSIGVKGGYNDMDVPTNTETGDLFGDTLTATQKKDKYVADIHVAYLFPISDAFQLGGQLGYSYYGKYKSTLTDNGSNIGDVTVKFFAPNLQLVGQWNIQQWFLQARAGVAYFKPTVSDSVDNYDYDTKSSWDAVAGISGGYFFTDNFSAEVFYDHVFGTDYDSVSDANTNSNKAPTMNSVGLGITYSF